MSNHNKISERLMELFQGYSRQIIFWYDDEGEFAGSVEEIAATLGDVKLHYLTKTDVKNSVNVDNPSSSRPQYRYTNQFHTKHLLEREDTQSHYLIYAPFPQPPTNENHLADTVRYSKIFRADHSSLLANDLQMDEGGRDLIRKYHKFFKVAKHQEKIKELESKHDEETLELEIISVLTQSVDANFEEILYKILMGDLENNEYLLKFEKYDIQNTFWSLCNRELGFSMESPTLEKLVYSLFLTATQKIVGVPLPNAVQHYISNKSGSVLVFLDRFMNYKGMEDRFQILSNLTYENILEDMGYFDSCDLEKLLSLQLYSAVEQYFLTWLTGRLILFDFAAHLDKSTLGEICHFRSKTNFGGQHYYHEYMALYHSVFLLKMEQFQSDFICKDIWENYIKEDFKIDRHYRLFYFHYDQIRTQEKYEELRQLVENIYTNKFLNPLSVNWTSNYAKELDSFTNIEKQVDFYEKKVKKSKERVVVIISDALRYEVAESLFQNLKNDEKCEPSFSAMMGVLPSYTRLGMSALLPRKKMNVTETFDVELDDKQRYDLSSRDECLRIANEKSAAIQYHTLDSMTTSALREFCSGKEVIYVYHDQIDARGDKKATEKQTFVACDDAISEIHSCIRKMASANNTKILVTADHGFIYKRDSIQENDKISGFSKDNVQLARRYLICTILEECC